MFGFSLSKLLVTVLIIAAVWYGFKFAGRLADAHQRNTKLRPPRRGGGTGTPGPTADLERCPVCGAYVAAEGAKACGRDDCPYPG